MSFSRRTLSLVTVLLLLGVLGAGVWWRLRGAESAAGEGSAAAGGAALGADLGGNGAPAGGAQFATSVPQPVSGAEVVRDTLWIRVGAAGTAVAYRRATLQAQVAGVVEELPVRENQPVSAAALLVRIDTVEYALGVAQARANLLAAETDYRQRVLFDDEIEDPAVRAERERIARALSNLDQRRLDVRMAELELARTRVGAPFEGRIADIRVVAGQHVTVGTELMTVVDLDPVKVEVQVLGSEIPLLAQGRRAEVTFAAFPGEVFTGRIETINPVIDPELRTGRVTIVLPNRDHRIKPGMYAEVSLDAEALPDRILVPRAALLERGEGVRRDMLFVYEPNGSAGLAKWRYVNPGRESDTMVELLAEGPEDGWVEPGEIVLVDGHHYLAHDTPVRLVEDVAAEGGRPSR